MKSLREISLPITEQQYREDGAMHYSTLSDFSRGGFHCIEHLGEKKESLSLLFGSVVDTLITGTPEEFENTYFVTDVSADSSDTLILQILLLMLPKVCSVYIRTPILHWKKFQMKMS